METLLNELSYAYNALFNRQPRIERDAEHPCPQDAWPFPPQCFALDDLYVVYNVHRKPGMVSWNVDRIKHYQGSFNPMTGAGHPPDTVYEPVVEETYALVRDLLSVCAKDAIEDVMEALREWKDAKEFTSENLSDPA